SYIPYGEIFVEESDNKGVMPYLFNAKELDEETGLYFYGARYLDPTGTMWLSVDPLFEKYVGMSPYGYCAGNPVRYIDPNGEDTVFFGSYGNELARLKSDSEVFYMIKTIKSTDEIYETNCSDEYKGSANPISLEEYVRAWMVLSCLNSETGISFSSSDIPWESFSGIPNSDVAKQALGFIRDDGTGGQSDDNNREYGFNVNWGLSSIYAQVVGSVATSNKQAEIPCRTNHTHPSGEKWQQPPSKQDILNAGYTPQYVWSLRNKVIYVYDSNGVNAVVPMSIYGK
ncbi:MAG: RHS repeat-associated core domain-containing protein, partial [Lachnospiraceae bacterium]|nr:RHS repeat-associated core domain-containing protein [Lachnospiraceae bacterium]